MFFFAFCLLLFLGNTRRRMGDYSGEGESFSLVSTMSLEEIERARPNLQTLSVHGKRDLSVLKIISSQGNQNTSPLKTLTALTALRVYGTRIPETPPEIFCFPSLKKLRLSDGHIVSFSHPHSDSPFLWSSLRSIEIVDCTLNIHLDDRISYRAPVLQKLDCSNNNLHSLPRSFGGLVLLRELNLEFNKLSSLPKDLTNLTNLTILNLNSNQLTTLPTDLFYHLTLLTTLRCDHNQLTTLPPPPPATTAQLSLRRLEASANRLITIPDLSCFPLERLELDHAAGLWDIHGQSPSPKELPDWFGKLRSLTRLSLYGIGLTVFPTLLYHLPKLTDLDLSDNPFGLLPQNFFLHMSQLKTLSINGIGITELPTEGISMATNLAKLYMQANDMKSLPEELCGLPRLEIVALPVSCLADSGDEELFDSAEVTHDYRPQLLIDICSLIVIKMTNFESEACVLPTELKERLDCAKKKCSGCGGIYFGLPRAKALNVRTIGNDEHRVWTSVSFCSPGCVDKGSSWGMPGLYGDEDGDDY